VAGTVAYMALWGEAFVAKYRAPDGGVARLGWIHPARVGVEKARNGEPIYHLSAGYGSDVSGTFNRRDVLHIPRLTMDGLRGLSPIAQAREALGLGIALQKHAARWFANGAVPGGVLEGDNELSNEAATRLGREFEARHGGVNAHRIAVLENGFKFRSIGMPMADVQFVEQRRLAATETARIFGLPAWAINAESGASMDYANVSQQRESLEAFSFRPYVLAIEQAIEGDPDLFDPDALDWPEFLMDAVARADVSTRFNAYKLADFMTDNEKRRRENLPDIEGGDELRKPGPAIAIHNPDPTKAPDA
jgi:HK97 family phage portal protein